MPALHNMSATQRSPSSASPRSRSIATAAGSTMSGF